MPLQDRYREFHDNIKLTRESDKYKAAREKDATITPKVEAAFKDKGYEVLPNFIQGSMATHTGIVPLDGDYDIDRGLAITHDSAPDDPVEPKKIIKGVLSDHGFSNPRIKKPCVTADYKADPMHIDYPTYRVDAGSNYQLAIGKENANDENKCWDSADPKGLNDWITASTNHQQALIPLSQAQKQQFYRLVRYLKRWRDYKYTSASARDKVYSIALTVMAKESFCPCEDDDGKPDDNLALKKTLDVILEQKGYFQSLGGDKYSIVVYLPVTPNRDIFDGRGDQVGTTLRNRMTRLRDALKEVVDMDSEKKQCTKLREQFGDDFPEGKETARVKQATAGLVGTSSGA
jgi:hypothetical protein